MGLRIRTNVSALTAQRFASQNNRSLNSSLDKLSSGYRINKSSDDAAGLAISDSLNAKIRSSNQAKRNANDGISMIQIAEGATSEMSNILIRMRELSVQSASDTIGDRERGYLNREYVQLAKELDRIGNTTEFNGNKIFQSEKENYVIQVGINGSDLEANEDVIGINLEGLKNLNTEAMGIGTEAEIGPSELDGSDPVDREDIVEKINILDTALTTIASERATLGSVQSRLNTTVKNLSISVENMSTAKSRIKDVDFASESSKYAQAKILEQSSVAMLAQANLKPEIALTLI